MGYFFIRKSLKSKKPGDRILKVARTIADLAGEDSLQNHHVGEAIKYLTIERMMLVQNCSYLQAYKKQSTSPQAYCIWGMDIVRGISTLLI
ncbi:hypothetical protein H6G18_03725 [Anabaena subtropica FACHB-260]|uniref:Mg chelatase-related protein C-terminal domain-containing protein n=1 Tax=Anabaena subtropica FACHB-260 TaxID=2692884 RepID=A0ABR8CJC6_9NOST|nr:hypothetical protein [Anabaena subtropica]MBD2343255.1 hypothetical protein [Anabaena subtropica FACHB-260]